MNRMRAFIAVHLSIPLVEKIVDLQTKLRDRAQQTGMKVAWVQPQGMHLTLKFLGDIAEESSWAIRDMMQARLAEQSAISLEVRGAGAFPQRARPRIIWAGIDKGAEDLTALAQEVDRFMEELGFAKETRPFHPHLTLGRVKAGHVDILEGLDDILLGSCMVHEVILYQSILHHKGASYKPLATVLLKRTNIGSGTNDVSSPPVE